MSDITLRSTLDRALTHDEVDANFSNLNADKYEKNDAPFFADTSVSNLTVKGDLTVGYNNLIEADASLNGVGIGNGANYELSSYLVDVRGLSDTDNVEVHIENRSIADGASNGRTTLSLSSNGGSATSSVLELDAASLSMNGPSPLSGLILENGAGQGLAMANSGAMHIYTAGGSLTSGNIQINASGVVTIPSIAITGGAIDGVPIGSTTPSTGSFTTLDATSGTITDTLTVDTEVDTTLLTTLSAAVGTGGLTVLGASNVTGNSSVSGNLIVDTDTLYVDSTNDRVGINQAIPLYPLHASTRTSGEDSFNVFFENTNSLGVTNILMGPTSDPDEGMITYNQNDNSLSFTANTNKAVTVGSSGNVGIGTSSPTYTLDVKNTNVDYAPAARFTDNGNATNWARIDIKNNNATNNTGLIIVQDNGGNAIIRNDNNDGTARGMTFAAGGTTQGYFAFNTGAAIERMRIDSSGNVGIGTSSPASLLDIRGGGGGTIGDARDSAQQFIVAPSSGVASMKLVSSTAQICYGNATTNGTLAFVDRAVAGNGTERMRIDASGNLLVGQTFLHSGAGAQLNVNGKIAGNGYSCRAGAVGAFTNNEFNIQWTGSPFLWVDSTNVGQISIVSDYRVKRNVETQTETALSRIEMLRPITYQYANYGDLFQESDDVQEGFLAHELAEVIPSAVNGEKDDKSQIQSLKVDALCSVMVKAIQELSAELNSVKAELAALKGV